MRTSNIMISVKKFKSLLIQFSFQNKFPSCFSAAICKRNSPSNTSRGCICLEQTELGSIMMLKGRKKDTKYKNEVDNFLLLLIVSTNRYDTAWNQPFFRILWFSFYATVV